MWHHPKDEDKSKLNRLIKERKDLLYHLAEVDNEINEIIHRDAEENDEFLSSEHVEAHDFHNACGDR